MKQYKPPYFFILFFIILTNIFFSTYFITILLIGVVFKIFLESLNHKYNYLLIATIFTFVIIETLHGIKIFTFSLISIAIVYLIIPRFKHLFASSIALEFINIFSLYFLFYIVTQSYLPFDFDILTIFIINFLIDIFIVGFII